MRLVRCVGIAIFLISAWPLLSQAAGDQAASSAAVTFSLDFPGSDPGNYTLSVDADGHAKYESLAKISQSSDERETYQMDFTFSPVGRARIFDLVAQAKYFSGKIDSGNKKLAFTGKKTLGYHDARQTHSAEYNYSTQAPVQQLTTLFQGVASTMEFGRHLTYFHRYQKLALDEELKRMESQAKENQLAELQAVRPILQDIYDDSSVINVVRSRAKRIMEMPSVDISTVR